MDWSRYEAAFEAIPRQRREAARRYVRELIELRGRSADDAVRSALARFGDGERPDLPHDEEALTSPDVSLALPHGPEGESHGGRAGRDPLRYVEDSTPAGTNAYSRTRGSPAQASRFEAPFVKRNVRGALPRRPSPKRSSGTARARRPHKKTQQVRRKR